MTTWPDLPPGSRARPSRTSSARLRLLQAPAEARVVALPGARLELADALERYQAWPPPVVIVADGPYGVAGYPGDPRSPADLAGWYEPHVARWAARAQPATTLWLWCTEVGWAGVHPVLDRHGWEYRALHVWDKGIAHVAGNVNGATIRGYPIVTEVCAQYTRRVLLRVPDGRLLPMRRWLREEWRRSGLPLRRANDACGVRDAATRKYFAQDQVWYFPPPEMLERLARYAARHGAPTSWPYFSLDGRTPVTAERWTGMRAKWHHAHGVTNVWRHGAVRGAERVRGAGARVLHANQKPLALMERIVTASSDPGDVVWEPFAGLASATIAAARTGRDAYAAEIDPRCWAVAARRLEQALGGSARTR
ncbi:MAG TPA: DNA methyltransferase [Actinomycetes bacterium]|nr:DNA methyltransferase [Actinomycetes bacterium]